MKVVLLLFLMALSFVDSSPLVPDWWIEWEKVGDMIISSDLPKDLKYVPYIGNGFLAANPLSDSLFLAGVFNGVSTDTPSHRARIPFELSVTISPSDSATDLSTVYSLDLKRSCFISRQTFKSSSVLIEQTWYSPRHIPSIVVLDININASLSATETKLKLSVNNGSLSSDISFTKSGNPPTGVTSMVGKTKLAEDPTNPSNLIGVGVAFTKIPGSITVPKNSIASYRFAMACHSTLNSQWENLVSQAISGVEFALSSKTLFNDHVNAWEQFHSHSGIDITGNKELSQKVNSSIYYILSSVKSDWSYGLSPGSLSSNSYNGHSVLLFKNNNKLYCSTETWMYPTMCLLFPDVAKSLLKYRIDRVDGAIKKAKTYNPQYSGAMYPWESAFTGIETTPTWAATGLREIHISGDISLAAWQYWNQTHDLNWLETALPMLEGIADFWVSKVFDNTKTDQYEILDVIPPDEYQDHVNNSAYTNSVAKISLQVAIEALKLLGHTIPTKYSEILPKIKIPFDSKLGIHPEYDGYDGRTIKQADVVLLGYPLNVPMPPEIRSNDLKYYSQRTDDNGPTMTYGMHTVGWLELGNLENAATAFAHSHLNMQKPFFVWSETPTGGAVNFITGAGGFLQAITAGYGGIRVQDGGLIISKPQLPNGCNSLRIRGIYVLGALIDVSNDGNVITILETESPVMINHLCVRIQGTTDEKQLSKGIPITFKSNLILEIHSC